MDQNYYAARGQQINKSSLARYSNKLCFLRANILREVNYKCNNDSKSNSECNIDSKSNHGIDLHLFFSFALIFN